MPIIRSALAIALTKMGFEGIVVVGIHDESLSVVVHAVLRDMINYHLIYDVLL